MINKFNNTSPNARLSIVQTCTCTSHCCIVYVNHSQLPHVAFTCLLPSQKPIGKRVRFILGGWFPRNDVNCDISSAINASMCAHNRQFFIAPDFTVVGFELVGEFHKFDGAKNMKIPS